MVCIRLSRKFASKIGLKIDFKMWDSIRAPLKLFSARFGPENFGPTKPPTADAKWNVLARKCQCGVEMYIFTVKNVHLKCTAKCTFSLWKCTFSLCGPTKPPKTDALWNSLFCSIGCLFSLNMGRKAWISVQTHETTANRTPLHIETVSVRKCIFGPSIWGKVGPTKPPKKDTRQNSLVRKCQPGVHYGGKFVSTQSDFAPTEPPTKRHQAKQFAQCDSSPAKPPKRTDARRNRLVRKCQCGAKCIPNRSLCSYIIHRLTTPFETFKLPPICSGVL